MTTKAPNVPRTTAKPQDTQRNDVREALLSAAMKLAAESRDLSFSLRQLAEAADTSTMSIYTQFGNREGLNRALSARAFGLFADELKRATADIDRKDVVPLLQRMAQAYRKFAQDHPSGFDLLFGDINSFDTVPPTIEPIRRPAVAQRKRVCGLWPILFRVRNGRSPGRI